MKVLFFADIHASKKACREIEQIINKQHFDHIVCCGDVVGYGTDPGYCINFLKHNSILTVKGNHEAMLLSEIPLEDNAVVKQSIKWTRENLDLKHIQFIQGLPDYLELEIFYITHSILGKYLYGVKDIQQDILEIIENINKDIIVLGHTHTQYCFEVDNKILLNPSSITKGRKGNLRGYAIYEDHNIHFVLLTERIT